MPTAVQGGPGSIYDPVPGYFSKELIDSGYLISSICLIASATTLWFDSVNSIRSGRMLSSMVIITEMARTAILHIVTRVLSSLTPKNLSLEEWKYRKFQRHFADSIKDPACREKIVTPTAKAYRQSFCYHETTRYFLGFVYPDDINQPPEAVYTTFNLDIIVSRQSESIIKMQMSNQRKRRVIYGYINLDGADDYNQSRSTLERRMERKLKYGMDTLLTKNEFKRKAEAGNHRIFEFTHRGLKCMSFALNKRFAIDDDGNKVIHDRDECIWIENRGCAQVWPNQGNASIDVVLDKMLADPFIVSDEEIDNPAL